MLSARERFNKLILAQPMDLSEKRVTIHCGLIQIDMQSGAREHVEFGMYVGDVLVATCDNPRTLSQYALENGALEVRHEYNLKIAEDMP